MAELALEYSGEKLVKDNTVEDKSESQEQKIGDDDKKKKGKKKNEKAEKIDIKEEIIDGTTVLAESNDIDMDGEVSTVKTAAQKKKEKKEREKQKKLAQKKAVSTNNYVICFIDTYSHRTFQYKFLVDYKTVYLLVKYFLSIIIGS